MRKGMTLALVVLAVLSVIVSACGSASPSASSSGASKPPASSAPAASAKPSSPAASASASAKPATSAAPSAAASGDWKAEWDKILAAAKKEGKVVVDVPPGDMFRDTALAFQKAYPEIKVEVNGADGNVFSSKLLAERDAGQYIWDVYVGGATTALSVFRPKGILDPLKPALLLPEVVDNSKWVGGLNNFWMDKEQQYIFGFEAGLQHTIFVNRDMVKESELSNHDQLLDPKWKGKIISGDLRTPGAQNGSTSRLLKIKGEDWLRKFYAQEITLSTDERATVEAIVRGRFPIAVGFKPEALQQFRAQGVADSIKPLDGDSEAGAGLSTGASHATLISKAPHPNAAKVFVNWLLSQDGQQTFVKISNLISARTDIEGGDPFFKPKPTGKYAPLNNEDMLPFKTKAMDIAKEIYR